MVCPRGVNHNSFIIVINPARAHHNGGVNENLTPACFSHSDVRYVDGSTLFWPKLNKQQGNEFEITL